MAPVQTFSSSPIVAAKAPTASTAHSPTTSKTAPATATAAPSSSSPSHGQNQPAQPGARPSIPAATSSASFPPRGATGHAAATPTRAPLPNSDSNSPPAPQPGAAPMPPGAAAAAAAAAAASTWSTLPPPPKSGETLGPEHTGAGQPPRALLPPAQLSYPPPPPTAPHTSLRGTSAAIPSPYEVGSSSSSINRATDLSHPPGYQQDAHAAEFSSGQRAAHEAYVAQHSNRLIMGMGLGAGEGGGEGGGAGDAEGGGTTIWNTAKKWAWAAGDTLAAAEGEVWKAVNKDHR
ncbi:hypothetical protein MY11210_003426 [Beauveria gryllotalpidicola]